MANDATTLLIQRILSQVDSTTAQGISDNASTWSQINGIVGTAANYAQVLGAAEGPIAQAIAIQVAGGAAAATATAAGQAALLSAAAVSAGVGAGIVLVFAFVLAALSANSGSSESEALDQLGLIMQQLQQDFTNVGLGTYWQDKFTAIQALWDSPQGGVGTDLDNLSNEGVTGINVKNDVSKFHDNAIAFVNNFIPSKTPGAQIYWERPVLANQSFAAQFVPYPRALDFPVSLTLTSITGWYGNLPQPQSAPSLGGPSNQMASDPRTMLSFLYLGLQSYLSLEMLVNLIDQSQPTFDQFVKTFANDLKEYAAFTDSLYTLAVNGIVKSDQPGVPDLIGFADFIAMQTFGTGPFQGTSDAQNGTLVGPVQSVATAGYVWNGIYGAVDTYPQYGFYQPSPPVPVPGAAPSYVIDLYNGDDFYDEWQQANIWNYQYLVEATLAGWVIPWLTDKVMLGTMARWKAIYLLNGYDQVWSTLQKLRFLTNPDPRMLLATTTLDQDGTIANGNWSARELCTTLNFDGNICDGIPNGSVVSTLSSGLGGYSVSALVQVLDNLANGNWAGPPSYSSSGPGPSRPLSFRDRLAAAAV